MPATSAKSSRRESRPTSPARVPMADHAGSASVAGGVVRSRSPTTISTGLSTESKKPPGSVRVYPWATIAAPTRMSGSIPCSEPTVASAVSPP